MTPERRVEDLQEAIEAYSQYAHLAADGQAAHRSVLDCLITQEQALRLTRAYTEAAHAGGKAWQAEMHLGATLDEMGCGAAACEAYQRATGLAPSNSDCWEALPVVRISNGDYSVAISAYESLLKLEGQSITTLRDIGSAYARAGEPDESAKVWQQIVQLPEATAHDYENLGNALEAAGNSAAAVEAFETAVRLSPESDKEALQLRLAIAQGKAHLRDRANVWTFHHGARELAAAREVFGNNPHDVQSSAALGLAFERLGSPNAAMAVYRDALRIDAEAETIHWLLGRSYLRKKQWDAARTEYAKTGRALSDPAYHRAQGDTLAGEDRLAEAIEEYRKAVALASEGERTFAYLSLARALYRANEYVEAWHYVVAARKLNVLEVDELPFVEELSEVYPEP